MFHRINKCRSCQGTDLVQVLDLGCQPLANDFQPAGAECAGYSPLRVMFCRNCTLAQLSVVVRPEILYRNYPYVTSDTETMKNHFVSLMADINQEHNPDFKATSHRLLEIGSNNGAFCQFSGRYGYEHLGMEPARNLAAIAEQRGIHTIPREFNEPSAIELAATGYRADVIVARHVFAHIDDWQGFIHSLELVSHEQTLVVIEVPWVVDLLNLFAFDTIYHEHLSYVSIRAVQHLLSGTDFYVDKVKQYSIHGGAIGIFLRRGKGPVIQLSEEDDLEARWLNLDALKLKGMNDLVRVVKNINLSGKKVCGFGASAKATVWLNAVQATRDQIDVVCDSTPQKQGKLIAGTDIPVVDEQNLYEYPYAVCFSWNFSPEIREKFKRFEEQGGKWILPIPSVQIVQ